MRVTWIWAGPPRRRELLDPDTKTQHARSSARPVPRASIDGIPEQTTCHHTDGLHERNHHV